MKNLKKKGFTLIELMIVLAIIAILAVVLIPKAAALKTAAKLAGQDTEMRQLAGQIHTMIPKYSSTAAQATKFEDDLRIKIGSSKDYINPLKSSAIGVDYWSSVSIGGVAVTYVNGDDAFTTATAIDSYWQTQNVILGHKKEIAGIIGVAAYPNADGTLHVLITPYDETGAPITSKVMDIN